MVTIPESISSPQDMLEAIEEIRTSAKKSAHDKLLRRTKAGAVQEASPLSKQASELVGLLGKKTAHTDLHAVADELQEIYKAAPRVDVTLAAPATPAIRQELTRWFRANVSGSVLLRIQVNSATLGGAVVRCGSHIYDWSFRSLLLAQSGKFTEVLGNVQ